MTTKLNTKKNVLIFVDWFWPGYLAGGPIQSIVSIIQYLNQEFNFYVITSNADLDKKPFSDILPNTWLDSPLGCKVFYSEPPTLSYKKISGILSEIEFDKIYINGLFSKNFSILPLLILKNNYPTIKPILAPRGMLGDGALLIKPFKKRLFFAFSKLIKLHKNVIWHATSKQEESEIKKTLSYSATIITLPNLPKKISNSALRAKSTTLHLCFISRVSFKKNLIFALEILNRITSIEILYSIYGPIEDKQYWNQCLDIIAKLPPNIKVEYKGTLKPNEIDNVYSESHALFLPTLNENFGHTIVESLLCGCPVIISDQTPWKDLSAHQAGYALNLNAPEAFVSAISHYANLNQADFIKASESAKQYITAKINISATVEHYKTLFHDCIKN